MGLAGLFGGCLNCHYEAYIYSQKLIRLINRIKKTFVTESHDGFHHISCNELIE